MGAPHATPNLGSLLIAGCPTVRPSVATEPAAIVPSTRRVHRAAAHATCWASDEGEAAGGDEPPAVLPSTQLQAEQLQIQVPAREHLAVRVNLLQYAA